MKLIADPILVNLDCKSRRTSVKVINNDESPGTNSKFINNNESVCSCVARGYQIRSCDNQEVGASGVNGLKFISRSTPTYEVDYNWLLFQFCCKATAVSVQFKVADVSFLLQ
ncbi:hypothetical protein QVD17_24513 [Tagetes erecta]|uniref:Uncharacterized protein n=1 Tax=Tagetes erecta TaxID=13708 RepID=A0AAD8KF67_TARER|nr:hypothetical protein QVD17_24513 [Tagetes erecta]